MNDGTTGMNIARIMEWLPHRYPFLLIDGISRCEAGKSISAWKNVTVNEPHFQGHFPGRPVMPGVLIIEAMAQAGGVLSYMTARDHDPDVVYYLAGVDEARFRSPVVPGDRLDIDVSVDSVKRGVWFYSGTASVAGRPAVTAKILCAPGREG